MPEFYTKDSSQECHNNHNSVMQTSNIFFVSLIVYMAYLLCVSPCSAEGLYGRFSLGTNDLIITTSDTDVSAPGAVTAKYGFVVNKDFMPYIGTGLAYTYHSNSKNGDITNLKTGLAAEFGFKYFLGSSLTLKLDYRYLSLSPELPQGDNASPPQLFGIGLDISF
ncbi:MAG: outer membrane beta-barrel protein [Desulfuromonadaceae bacterium]|nr:outer membrane beta-barrel protein [Desulfuromonadaceae bacterium]MDD2855668.1 outer membrane beta-barrel protein [Desulfuromonadaceae bacterium]